MSIRRVLRSFHLSKLCLILILVFALSVISRPATAQQIVLDSVVVSGAGSANITAFGAKSPMDFLIIVGYLNDEIWSQVNIQMRGTIARVLEVDEIQLAGVVTQIDLDDNGDIVLSGKVRETDQFRGDVVWLEDTDFEITVPGNLGSNKASFELFWCDGVGGPVQVTSGRLRVYPVNVL